MTLSALVVGGSLSSLFGAQPFLLGTDGSGAITGGATWTSTGTAGTITPSLAPGAVVSEQTFVSGFSGTGTLDNLPFFANEGRFSTNPTATVSVTLGGGGSGDLIARNASGGGAVAGGPSGTLLDGYFDSFALTGLTGVNSITFTTVFSDPIANTSFGGDPTGQLTFVPWIATVNVPSAGGALGAADYSLTTSLIDVVTTVDGGTTWLPDTTGMAALTSPGYNPSAPGSTTFTADALTTSEKMLVKGLDVNGDSTFDQTDLQSAYAAGISYTITLDSGDDIPSDAIFRFTYDGAQFSNSVDDAAAAIEAIPELSSTLLTGMAGLIALFRRRR